MRTKWPTRASTSCPTNRASWPGNCSRSTVGGRSCRWRPRQDRDGPWRPTRRRPGRGPPGQRRRGVTFVRTVLGDIEPSELGVTYSHEHLGIDGGRAVLLEPDFDLSDVDRMATEV